MNKPLSRYMVINIAILVLLVEFLSISIHKMACNNSVSLNSDIQLPNMLVDDLKSFPIPLSYRNQITYEDSYGAYRSNGSHDGCDLMYSDNKAGIIPIISASDGEITNLGWLYLGGYRIGITSPSGYYFYYAHLDSYAKGLNVGDPVIAGQLLGFMGSTGEGEEGTSDKFDVHLHFAIYEINNGQTDHTIDPYSYLKTLEAIH